MEIYHESYDLWLMSSVLDVAGNIYACGLIAIDGGWPLIMKFNACGELQWCRIYMNTTYLYGWACDMLLTDEGELIVLATINNNSQIDQIFLMSLTNDGDVLWIHPYASKNDHPLIALAIPNSFIRHNEQYIITGRCYWPYPDDPDHVFLRPLFIGVDSVFNEEWIIPFGVSDSIHGKAFESIPLNDSVFIGVGMLRLEGDKIHGLYLFYDKNGNELGYTEIPNEAIEPGVLQNYPEHIKRINDSLFITSGSIGYNSEYYPRGDMVTDTAGNIYNFALRAPTSSSSELIKTFDNKYVVATAITIDDSDKDIYLYKMDENLISVPVDTAIYTYDSLCDVQIESGIIDITDCLIVVSTEEIPAPQEYYARQQQIIITSFPNPATTRVIFKLENTEKFRNITLSCYDIYGRQLHSCGLLNGQQECSVDVSGWNSGAYIAIVKSKGRIAGRSMFVVN